MGMKLWPQSMPMPPGTDPGTPTELASISQNLRDLTSRFDRALAVLSVLAEAQSKIVIGLNSTPVWVPEVRKIIADLGSAIVTVVRPKNLETIEVHQLVLPSANSALQFPVLPIPWDHSVVIKALAANAGTIYIAGSKQDGEDTSRSYPLAAGETIEYKISDLSALWAAASVAAEGLIWTVEAKVG